MREWVANRVINALNEGDAENLARPTSKLGVRIQEPDESEIVLISHGDSFDLICGKVEYAVIHVSPKAALKLAWFILWRWWFLGSWLGVKLSAWHWALTVKIEEGLYRKIRNSKAPHHGRR